jgi:transketolase
MEGVSYEALSLAGSLELNKLIVMYDCNKITLDGDIKGVMGQNILAYMKSLNFNTLEVEDGNDVNQIIGAIKIAKTSNKPTFIKINTKIGYGSVLEGSNKAHGSALGEENVKLLREKLGVTTEKLTLSKDTLRDLQIQKKTFEVRKRTNAGL